MIERINSIVKDYLQAPKTDYAIMISGEWGCGKTHYLHHGFKDLLSKINVPPGDGDSELKKSFWNRDKGSSSYYSPAFISLYGVSSVEDFEYKVFCGVNPWASNRWFRLATKIGGKIAGSKGISGDKSDVSAVTFISRSKVLVFDDLERLCEDRISVKEVLGLINSYAEHSHLKVIIVCNEKEYFPDSEVEIVDDDYKKYKEKSVRFTYKFMPDEAQIYDAMVNDLPENDYKKYLVREKASILSLFTLGGEKNLRTLKFVIDSFNKVYIATKSANYCEKILRTYLVTFMLYAFEHKRGRIKKDLDSLDISTFKIDTSNFFDNQQRDNSQTQEHIDYPTEFKEKYKEVYSDFKPNHLLIDYIETGWLDENRFNADIQAFDKELEKLAITKEGIVYQKLLKMPELDDREIPSLLVELKSYIKADKYNLYDLLNVYALLLKYDYYHINDFSLSQDWDDEFIASINRQQVSHRFDHAFDIRTPIWDSNERGSYQYEKYKVIKDEAIRINREVMKRAASTVGETFLLVAESGDVKKLREYRQTPENRISVSGIDWTRVFDLIKNGPNQIACEVCECIIFFIPFAGYLGPSEAERIQKEFKPLLEDYVSQNIKLVRLYYVVELNKHLNAVL